MSGHSAPQAMVCVWKGMDPPPGVQGGDACECPYNTFAAVCPSSQQSGIHESTVKQRTAGSENLKELPSEQQRVIMVLYLICTSPMITWNFLNDATRHNSEFDCLICVSFVS